MTQAKKRWLKALGYVLCVVPAALATMEHFPLWFSKTQATVSVLSVAVLLLCMVPFRRGLRAMWKNPSAWFLWLCLLLILKLTAPLSQGLLAVAGVAFPTSLLGALCFRLARIPVKESQTNDRP